MALLVSLLLMPLVKPFGRFLLSFLTGPLPSFFLYLGVLALEAGALSSHITFESALPAYCTLVVTALARIHRSCLI